MQKLLYFFMILPVLFCSQTNVMSDLFSEVSMVEIYKDGQVIIMDENQQKEFDDIFCLAIKDARQMPAFGVSLDNLTKEEMKSGYWVRFIFDKTVVKSDMPFDELLLHVTKDAHGINIIRGNDGVYQGRCYYLDLENSLNDLYDFIDGLSQKGETKVELESQEIEPTMVVSEEDVDSGEDETTGGNGKKGDDEQTMTKSQQELLSHLE